MKLRELTIADEENILSLDSDPEVMRYLTDGRPSTRFEARSALERAELLFKKHEGKFGFWAAIEKETKLFRGWFHFRPSKQDPENIKRIELGYRLKREFWGKDYATEGSRCLIEKGFAELAVEEVFAVTMQKNIASRKVMEKSGLIFFREFHSPDFPDTKELDVEYLLNRDGCELKYAH